MLMRAREKLEEAQRTSQASEASLALPWAGLSWWANVCLSEMVEIQECGTLTSDLWGQCREMKMCGCNYSRGELEFTRVLDLDWSASHYYNSNTLIHKYNTNTQMSNEGNCLLCGTGSSKRQSWHPTIPITHWNVTVI